MYRITPACAGTTVYTYVNNECVVDHPRLCGDYLDALEMAVSYWGSPPLVRGLLTLSTPARLAPGITPACAGTTLWGAIIMTVIKDHPRLCGDYNLTENGILVFIGSPPLVRGYEIVQNTLDHAWGSPPLVRGLHRYPMLINAIMGITPACAGTTNLIAAIYSA